MTRDCFIGCWSLSFAILCFPLGAQTVPNTISYQGRLTDNTPSQTPVTQTLPMIFSIWTSVSGGSQVWTETWSAPGVTVTGGLFSLILGTNGAAIPATVFSGGTSRYLQIVVNGETLSPRQQLGSTGWAMQAEAANTATIAGVATELSCVTCVDADEVQFNYAGSSSKGGAASDVACTNCVSDGEVADGISIDNGRLYAPSGTGDVGIGTVSPSSVLHVVDTATFDDQAAVYGAHVVTDNYGVGVHGEGKWRGVYGHATTSTGSAAGLVGDASGSGTGLRFGVFATASGGDSAFAGYFVGNTHIDGKLTLSTKTRHLIVPPSSFSHNSNQTFFLSGNELTGADGIAMTYYAPVQLPMGASITRVEVGVKDVHATGDLELSLCSTGLNSPGVSCSVTLDSGAVAQGESILDSGALSLAAVSSTFTDLLRIRFPNIADREDCTLRSTRITYTVTEPLP